MPQKYYKNYERIYIFFSLPQSSEKKNVFWTMYSRASILFFFFASNIIKISFLLFFEGGLLAKIICDIVFRELCVNRIFLVNYHTFNILKPPVAYYDVIALDLYNTLGARKRLDVLHFLLQRI